MMSKGNQSKASETTTSRWGFFIDNIRLTYLLIAAIVLFGIFSVIQMPKESAPEVDIPVAVVTTALPGASTIDVETLVTDPIEEGVEGISNIDKLTSISRQGFSQITVEFSIDSDTDESTAELRNRVDRATPELPTDATDPQVQKISFADQPIATLAVSGPYDLATLGDYGDIIAGRLETIPNVSAANVSGNPEAEYSVVISQNKLAQQNLSINDVARSLQSANTDIPIGSIETAGKIYTVRFAGRLEMAADIRAVPVKSTFGSIVRLDDIARVQAGYAPLSVENRFARADEKIEPAVSVSVFKESGQGDIISVVASVDAEIESLRGQEIPADVTIEKIRNDAELISSDLSNLLFSGAVTMLIIFTLLVLFLGIREAVLASLSVPLTFLAGLGILYYLGYTINFLSLFSLILVLGILVDASIVITEGFSSALQDTDDPKEAARRTLQEFKGPLTAGTLTTVFAFAPILIAGGTIGKFIRSIPVTVSVVLLCALFVALSLLTALGARFFAAGKKTRGASRRIRRGIDRVYARYSAFLKRTLRSTRRRTTIFISMIVLLFLALALPITGLLQTTLFPEADMDIITINLELPVTTPLAESSQAVSEVASYLQKDERIDSLLISAGSQASVGSITLGRGEPNLAGIVVSLAKERQETSGQIIAELNQELPKLTEAAVSISQQSGGPPTGQPVQVNITGDDLSALEISSDTVVALLEEISGATNINSEFETGSSEFVAVVDRAAAERIGVTPQTVATLLRTYVSGFEVTSVKSAGDDTAVVLRFSEARQPKIGTASAADVSDLSGITVQTNRGSTSLEALVDFRLASSLPAIFHDDGDRQVTISADTTLGVAPAAITNQLKEALESATLPAGVSLSFGGEAEDVAESFADLFLSMIIGIILIFALLTWQFNSYRQPLFMLATIPLALVGVFFGLALVSQPLSFPAFIGVVALAGIVVNNAIILIDRINTNRIAGMEFDRSIYEGARSRLQPILLTTLTTAGGMIPLLFADQTWAPVAYAIIFGLTFSTILTLVVVPLLYQRFER